MCMCRIFRSISRTLNTQNSFQNGVYVCGVYSDGQIKLMNGGKILNRVDVCISWQEIGGGGAAYTPENTVLKLRMFVLILTGLNTVLKLWMFVLILTGLNTVLKLWMFCVDPYWTEYYTQARDVCVDPYWTEYCTQAWDVYVDPYWTEYSA